MKYKVNDRVRIKSLDWYYDNRDRIDEVACGNTNFIPDMVKYCEEIVTISSVLPTLKVYHIKEDGGMFNWTNEMIEGLVEEETTNIIEEAKTYWDSIKDAWICPEGYIFKDENGNVINATKIVLEKKKKDVNLTQDQINIMVHDSCVLFCKHCGCGIPRETCTSLGTCKEHDEYRTAIRTHLMENKKKEYPKTFLGCCDVLGIEDTISRGVKGYKSNLLDTFQKLLICRDAYWKIAGEEMGLGKPWEPSGNENCFVISRSCGEVFLFESGGDCEPFEFPTKEMRTAFYENFKELIETVKELL